MMVFFENNNRDLLSYLPFFMQEYRELKELIKAEEPEFKIFWEKLKIIFGNQFIEYCNEEGIAKFETMLDLHYYENDTLETRIFRVLTAWNDLVPYTWRVLINKMDQLCGVGNYILELKNNTYELNITTRFDDDRKYDELNNMIGVIKPANLGIKSVNVLTPKAKNTLYMSCGVVTNIHNLIKIGDL